MARSSTKPDAWTLSPQMTAAPELWRGCVGFVPAWNRTPRIILNTGATPTVSSGVDFTPGISGLSTFHKNNTGSQEVIEWADADIPEFSFGTGNFSFFALLQDDLTGTQFPFYRFVNKQIATSSPYEGFGFFRAGGTSTLTAEIRDQGGTGVAIDWDNYPRQEPLALLITSDKSGNSHKMYGKALVSGTDFEATDTTAGMGNTDATVPLIVGNYRPNGNDEQNLQGRFYALAGWSRALSEAEAKALVRDPFAMLRPAGF